MKVHKIILMLVSIHFMFVFSVLTPHAAMAAEDPIVVGIFPRRNAGLTFKIFKPMMVYLSERLGREVKLVTPKDFKTFWKDVESEKFDLVHYNQYHYVASKKKFGYEVILKNSEFGSDKISGGIFVRKDSGINTVQELKGKKIIFGGGPKAMQSYIIATYLLNENGLKKGDYEESFAKNPPNALLAVYFRKAHAAGSGDVVLNLPNVKKMVDSEKLAALVISTPHAHLPWAVKGDMDRALKQKIQSILSQAKETQEGEAVLKTAKLDALEIAEDAEYNPHRKMIKVVTGESF